MQSKCDIKFKLKYRFINQITAISIFVYSINVTGEICEWENPKNTMKLIFSKAQSYKTITKVIDEGQKKIIEKKIGFNLHPSENINWTYYKLDNDKGKVQGYISTIAEKSDNETIEIVMGVDPDGTIKGVYLQNASKEDKVSVSDKFLKRFRGKTIKHFLKQGNDSKSENTAAEITIIRGVKKMLVLYDELGKTITKLADILFAPSKYDFKTVTLEGIFEGICCAADFYYKEENKIVEILGRPSADIDKGDKVRIKVKIRACMIGEKPTILVKSMEKK